MRVLSTLVAGKESRYCQQCHKFHEMALFDSSKRSCRISLQRRSDNAAAKSAAKSASQAHRKGPREATAPGSSGASRALEGKQQLLLQLAESDNCTPSVGNVKMEPPMHGLGPVGYAATGVMQGPLLELSDWACQTLNPGGGAPGVGTFVLQDMYEPGQRSLVGMDPDRNNTYTGQEGRRMSSLWTSLTSPEWHPPESRLGELLPATLDDKQGSGAMMPASAAANGQLLKVGGEVRQMMETARRQLEARSPLQQLPAQRALQERTGLQLNPNPLSSPYLQAWEGSYLQPEPPSLMDRLSIKMYGVTPDALPLDLLHRLQGWVNVSGLDVVQASIRPGCTMLVLDMIMEDGCARASSEQLLHPFLNASQCEASRDIESLLGPAVVKAANEIKMQAGCQVVKLHAKQVLGGKEFVAKESTGPDQLIHRQVNPPSLPHLHLAYPRCLLAGQVLSSLTLTISTSIQTTQVRVFARHNGMFLPSCYEQEETSSLPSTSTADSASLACVIVEVPGTQSYPATWLTPARSGELGQAYESNCKLGSMNDIFFNLNSPDTQGLISIEFEVPDGGLSNWKPILVVDDEEVVCELRALALPQDGLLDMQVDSAEVSSDSEDHGLLPQVPEPVPAGAEVEAFLVDMGLLLQITNPGSALLARPLVLRWGMIAAMRCQAFIETWQTLSLDATAVLLTRCWDRLLALRGVPPSASNRGLTHSGHASISSVGSSFHDLHPELSVQRLESLEVDRSSCEDCVKGPGARAAGGYSAHSTAAESRGTAGGSTSSIKRGGGDRISPISPVPMHRFL
ncbi:hypothetical protein CEUSTIGMA_g9139.t1 [Chlamydomonas eustigma]|uniref:SBP-type domain-containing protein n=1 Tax=Chlamydomonas eustigma TaxID=1157962 RepID=A0A250XF65_9CHLO|nr:hypothetical protein CEUSTIGMA_g9139.t1 [Chlamydomonas eustigma]|eukprot:GAX81711.1 hypothetical protein CEUSTIGMA_g9139.t1 [Chlamydomonas eustigma]